MRLIVFTYDPFEPSATGWRAALREETGREVRVFTSVDEAEAVAREEQPDLYFQIVDLETLRLVKTNDTGYDSEEV